MGTPTLQEQALKMLEFGWSIIPVRKDKTPLVKWTEFQERRATPEEVVSWFEKNPDAQIAIVTGKISNLTVIDIEAGGDFDIVKDKTFKVKSGGGGIHYYFKYEPSLQTIARILPLTDIRNDRGLCHAYCSESVKGKYQVIDGTEIAKMSEETRLLFLPKKKEFVYTPTTSLPDDQYALVNDYPGFGPGVRNQEMASFIGKVLKKVNPLHWSTIAYDIVCRANQKNSPPLNSYELTNTFKSIQSREAVSAPVFYEKRELKPDVQEIPKPPAGESDEIKHISVVAAEQTIDESEFYPTDIESFDEALEGGFFIGDLVIVAAGTGQGKTTWSQDIALSIIRGGKTGRNRKAPVLFFSYEVLPTHLWKKFKMMGMTEEDIAVIPAKHTSGKTNWVKEKIKEGKEKFGIKVVVIDHLGFLLPSSMEIVGKNVSTNHSTFVTQIVRDIKNIARDEEVIIIMPVHIRKTEKELAMEDIKDSAGISQEADSVFLIERERARGKESTSYYTPYTKITLAKNRKTGMSVSSWFVMEDNRFANADVRKDIEAAARALTKDVNIGGEEKKVDW